MSLLRPAAADRALAAVLLEADSDGKRRRVLLFAPYLSYRIAAYQQAASVIGVDLTLASNARMAATDVRFPGIDLGADRDTAIARVLDAARSTPFDGVISTDDLMVELASTVAATLQIGHNPPMAARFSRRKDLARQRQREAGLPIPNFRLIDLEQPLGTAGTSPFSWPSVIKPLAWSGSRGVMRVDSEAHFLECAARLKAMLAAQPPADEMERSHALLEEFVPGMEVAVEALLRDGELIPLAVFDKPDPLDGPFFEETYYVTPSRLPVTTLDRLHDVVAGVCKAYGLTTGPVHAELRVDGDNVWLVEVAARTIGGDCARLLRFGSGYGLEELVLANAVGRQLNTDAAEPAGGVLMIPTRQAGVLRRVEGVTAASRVPLIDEVTLSVNSGYELTPLPEGSSYLGFIFARGPDARSVESALREAHDCLRVVIAPKLDVTIGT
jgi:biotin carboxylase